MLKKVIIPRPATKNAGLDGLPFGGRLAFGSLI